MPATTVASLSPGHGGMVAPTAINGSLEESQRNWKCVPRGIVSEVPWDKLTICVWSPCCAHICPVPAITYQISSTVRWLIALETSPGASVK